MSGNEEARSSAMQQKARNDMAKKIGRELCRYIYEGLWMVHRHGWENGCIGP